MSQSISEKPQFLERSNEFVRGSSDGIRALEPDVEIVSAFSGINKLPVRKDLLISEQVKLQRIRRNTQESAKQYMGGYIPSLQDFMKEHGYNDQSIVSISTIILENPEVLAGYVMGLRREKPPLVLPPKSTYSTPFSRKHFLPNHDSVVAKTGHTLGFAVSVARDFGLPVSFDAVPTDQDSFDAWQQALDGQERPIPLVSHSSDNRDKIKAQEASYKLGLRVRLIKDGIEGIEPEQIRSPRALRALNNGLKGVVMPEYEVYYNIPPHIVEPEVLDPALARVLLDNQQEFDNAREVYNIVKRLVRQRKERQIQLEGLQESK